MKILTANFHLHQIQNCFGQIKKMEDKIFSFQLKKKKNYFRQAFTDNARLKSVPPPYLTRILKPYQRTDGRKFPEK